MNIFIDKNCIFTTRSTGKLKLKFWVQQLQNNNILSFSKKKGGTRSPRLFHILLSTRLQVLELQLEIQYVILIQKIFFTLTNTFKLSLFTEISLEKVIFLK